jgi:hypothetical protein
MSHVSSIFTLKPIVDLFHNDALQYVIEINQLKDQIVELKKENAQLREIITTPIKIEKVEIDEATNVIVREKKIAADDTPEIIVKEEKPRVALKNIVIDDTVYSKEAETYAEPVNAVVENTEKVVVVNEEKSRKEYQQEYQRQYRKLKKERQQGVIKST